MAVRRRREQDARLLERLAIGADPVRERRGGRVLETERAGGAGEVERRAPADGVVGIVVELELAAGKHEVARGELAGVRRISKPPAGRSRSRTRVAAGAGTTGCLTGTT